MSKRTVQIKLVVTPEENEQIRKNAKACDMTTSAYIREVAVNMCVFPLDITPLTEHTRGTTQLRKAINMLVFTIRKSGSYIPVDLEYILKKLNEILKMEGRFLDHCMEMRDMIEKSIANTVRTIVEQHLTKKTD